MNKFLDPTVIIILTTSMMVLFFLIRNTTSWAQLTKVISGLNLSRFIRRKVNVLNCRTRLTKTHNNDAIVNAFSIEICGSIHLPPEHKQLDAQINIIDITKGLKTALPLQTNVQNCQVKQSSVFNYVAKLGITKDSFLDLHDWIAIALIPVDWLQFPKKGKRKLLFVTRIISAHNDQNIIHNTCELTYENNSFGFLDYKKYTTRIKDLTLSLAFTVASNSRQISKDQITIIEQWMIENITLSEIAVKIRSKLNKFYSAIISFLPACNRIRARNISNKIIENAPLAMKCDILELCLTVVRANGSAATAQLEMLKKIAAIFEISKDRFHFMMEKIIPASIQEIEDLEISFGLTDQMDAQQIRQQLTKEYNKWNSRTSNADPEIQRQTEYMLKRIAKLRTKYTQTIT